MGRERAVLFSTGYMANLGVIGALVGRRGLVVEDRLNHASLIDAGLLSGAKLLRYAHADTVAAELAFGAVRDGAAGSHATRGQRMLVTDGLFSMDGDLAPLPELARIAAAKNARGAATVFRPSNEFWSYAVSGLPVVNTFSR